MNRLHRPIAISLLAMATAAQAAQPRYVDSRQVLLGFRTASDTPIQAVNLWVSTDRGRTWQKADAELAGPHTVRYKAPGEGRFEIYLVLNNAAGRSGDPPAACATPHATVVVDTTPPTLQLHETEVIKASDERPQVRLSLSLIEEHLGEAGLRLFYRTSRERPWLDGGPVTAREQQLCWPLPENIGPTIDIRLVATDLAGNRAWQEITAIQTSASRPAQVPAPPPERLTIEPVQRTTIEPVALVSFEEPPPAQPADTKAPATGAAALRRLAQRHASAGQLDLATARLEDALARAPQDPDLLVDLGSLLYRAERHDEAERRFQTAAQLASDHVGAREGLALVAATQNRYADARAHLERLLRVAPESGRHWLRYGDMEHKLGNAAAANRAWERVLKAAEADESALEKAKTRLKHFGPASRPARP